MDRMQAPLKTISLTVGTMKGDDLEAGNAGSVQKGESPPITIPLLAQTFSHIIFTKLDRDQTFIPVRTHSLSPTSTT